jgi:cytoskeleton protein RodZ
MDTSAGSFLKAERLKKNKSLKDIADSTRIGIFTLEALEADKTELLPPQAYVRGFIKVYARELDISPDEPLALYAAQVQAEHTADVSAEVKQAAQPFPIPVYAVPVIAGAVVLLICALFFGYKGRPALHNEAGSGPEAPTVVQTVESQLTSLEQEIAPASKPAAADIPVADNASAAQPPNPFEIRFVAAERCWMRFTVDGKHVFEVTLKKGETYSVNAVYDIRVRIGNPSGLTAFFNNSPVPIPGRRGRPVEMTFPLPAGAQPVSSP